MKYVVTSSIFQKKKKKKKKKQKKKKIKIICWSAEGWNKCSVERIAYHFCIYPKYLDR